MFKNPSYDSLLDLLDGGIVKKDDKNTDNKF